MSFQCDYVTFTNHPCMFLHSRGKFELITYRLSREQGPINNDLESFIDNLIFLWQLSKEREGKGLPHNSIRLTWYLSMVCTSTEAMLIARRMMLAWELYGVIIPTSFPLIPPSSNPFVTYKIMKIEINAKMRNFI